MVPHPIHSLLRRWVMATMDIILYIIHLFDNLCLADMIQFRHVDPFSFKEEDIHTFFIQQYDRVDRLCRFGKNFPERRLCFLIE